MKSQPQELNVVVLDALRVPCQEVLGQFKPLTMAKPFSCANTKGDLKEIDNYLQVEQMGMASGARFKTNIRKTHV